MPNELPDDLKGLFIAWLDELIEGLSPKQEQLKLTYTRARTNLAEEPGPFNSTKQLRKVRGIGDTIVRRLTSKLEIYCKDNDILNSTSPSKKTNTRSVGTTKLRLTSNTDYEDVEDGSPIKKKRKYIPKKRSGGYAILLALLEMKPMGRQLSKDEIIKVAQKYTDSSLQPNFATKEFYSSWNAINSLLKHGLVLEEGRSKRYCLSETGIEFSETLKKADGIIFASDLKSDEPKPIKEAFPDISTNLSSLLEQNNHLEGSNQSKENDSILDTSFSYTSTPQKNHALSYPNVIYNDNTDENSLKSSPTKFNSGGSKITDHILMRKRWHGNNYEVWSPGSYEILPIIDHREVKSSSNRDFFSNGLANRDIKSEVRQLALGDIIWVAKNKVTGYLCVLNTIIERKRLDDLAMSIKDNRFMEQKNRLEKSGCSHIYYLIEDTVSPQVGQMAEALKTAFWMILIYYRFSLIKTVNADETIEKLAALDSVVKDSYKKKNLLVIYPNDVDSRDTYLELLKLFKDEFEQNKHLECCYSLDCFQEVMGKNESKTIAELTIYILMMIKGVSLEKAVAIQSHFPTLNHILCAYRDCKEVQDAKLLMYNKLGNAVGAKKISKALSVKIAETFMRF